ncbi:MAG: protein kinase family protein [Endozoicomonas sp. (ex Botrylloides leachii)]|nr:protein kinase family protein [Endozoicomonas sp. (ex Botrylloides leachii)]
MILFNRPLQCDHQPRLKITPCDGEGRYLGKRVKPKYANHKLAAYDKNANLAAFDKNKHRFNNGNIININTANNISNNALRGCLENIYHRMQTQNNSMKEAAINDLKKLFSRKNISVTDLKKVLTSINKPWADACLSDQEMIAFTLFTAFKVSDLADKLTKIVSYYIIKNPDNIILENKKQTRYKASYLDNLRNDKKNIPDYNMPSRLPNKPAYRKPALIKKSWQFNREDKLRNNLPFTRVQAENLKGQLFTAELLNSVPDEVLKKYGWSKQEIGILPTNKDKAYLSNAAETNLGLKHMSIRNNFRYFGQGGFGKVKLARIQLPSRTRPQVCVAKKMSGHTVNLQETKKEIALQNQSGVAPRVYGLADTKNKKNSRQYIVFMEPAKGCNGYDYIHQQRHKMTIQDRFHIAENYLNKIQVMHRNGVFHQDIKLNNSVIDPKTKAVQILDFGLAVTKQEKQENGVLSDCSYYMPPELVFGGRYSYGDYDKEKGDVFSLGLLLARLFSTESRLDRRAFAAWGSSNNKYPSIKIARMLASLNIGDTKIYNLVKRMTNENPKARPTMKEVLGDFQRLKEKQRSDRFSN